MNAEIHVHHFRKISVGEPPHTYNLLRNVEQVEQRKDRRKFFSIEPAVITYNMNTAKSVLLIFIATRYLPPCTPRMGPLDPVTFKVAALFTCIRVH